MGAGPNCDTVLRGVPWRLTRRPMLEVVCVVGVSNRTDAPSKEEADTMPTLEQILDALRSCLPALKRLGVVELELFGSFARGDARMDSDVDVLVTFAETPSFATWLDARDLLTLHVGRPVDLVMATAVKPRMREVVAREAIPVA